MSLWLLSSNKGWHKQWFYLKDNTIAPLPVFSRHLIEEALEQWEWGVLDKDKKKIDDHRVAIMFLKERGLKGSGVIGAYHMRRVAPLMACTLPLYRMAPDAPLEGTVLAEGHSLMPKLCSASRRRWRQCGTWRGGCPRLLCTQC
jgi:hypothetical protein